MALISDAFELHIAREKISLTLEPNIDIAGIPRFYQKAIVATASITARQPMQFRERRIDTTMQCCAHYAMTRHTLFPRAYEASSTP